MDAITHALSVVGGAIVAILSILYGLFAGLDGWLRGLMTSSGVPHEAQTLILVVVAVLFIIAALRLLGGLLRLLIIVFLILLLLHVVFPGGIPATPSRPT